MNDLWVVAGVAAALWWLARDKAQASGPTPAMGDAAPPPLLVAPPLGAVNDTVAPSSSTAPLGATAVAPSNGSPSTWAGFTGGGGGGSGGAGAGRDY